MPRAACQRIDWGKQENIERLLAAILAAQGLKMDYSRVAKMFGYGATYSSIEGQLRKAKRIAATLSDDRKKSEEIALTEDGTKSKETHSGAHFTPALVKRSAQLPSWGFSAEVLVKEEKKGMVGTKVLGGRVVKGSAASAARGSGRKKEGIKVEDEVEVLEVFHLDDG